MPSFFPNISFSSFRARLIVFLLCLLIPVLGGIFYYVNRNNTSYTEQTINSYLQLSAAVFDDTRAQQARTLDTIVNSLTWDFGFRTAYAARDPATLFDAALNVLERSLGSADMLMIIGLDNKVVIDPALQGYESAEGSLAQLIAEADRSESGRAEMIAAIDGTPFQLIALPLYLPRQVAWIVGGFALDGEFVSQVKETTLSEISIVRLKAGQASVVASTLSGDRQQSLIQQAALDERGLDTVQRIAFETGEYSTLLRRLYGEAGDEEQDFAVIQRSYDENNANVVQFRRLLVQFYLLVFAFSLVGVAFLARSITRPVSRLARVVKHIEAGDYERRVTVESRDELGQLAESVNSMAGGLAEKEKVRDLLGKVVSHEIAEQLLSNPVELGGEERVVTILFSDIRGFTSFCEGLAPQRVLASLNQVLSRISDIIEKHGGVVDKFNGDAVMALFGAPVQGEEDAAKAMMASLEIIAALEGMDSELSACVGVNTGLVVAGNLGSSNRLNYSVIGDTVNLAARLEGLTRLYHVSSIVSEATVAATPDFVFRELDRVRVAGKREAVTIYELIGRKGEVGAELLGEVARFGEALAAYRQQHWEQALELFSQLAEKCDNAPLYTLFIDRIQKFQDVAPGPHWNGVFDFDSK